MSTTTSNLVLACINVFVAIGTLALAGVTAWMARETSREVKTSVKLADSAEQQVKASEEQAAVARESLLAAIQPILAEVPSDVTTRVSVVNQQMGSLLSGSGYVPNTDPAHITLNESSRPDGTRQISIRLPIWNVGHGPALITSARLTSVGGTNKLAEPMATIVAASQQIELPFVLWGSGLGGFKLSRSDGYPDFSVEVDYTNAFGSEPRTTKLDVSQRPDPVEKLRCVIVGVTLCRPDNPTPIVRSNFIPTPN